MRFVPWILAALCVAMIGCGSDSLIRESEQRGMDK